jgi:hypothetical protein
MHDGPSHGRGNGRLNFQRLHVLKHISQQDETLLSSLRIFQVSIRMVLESKSPVLSSGDCFDLLKLRLSLLKRHPAKLVYYAWSYS